MESTGPTKQSTPVQVSATGNEAALFSADSVARPVLGDTELDKPRQESGEAGFRSRTSLALTVSDSNYQFMFDADVVEEIGIGRYDYHTDTAPLIDLTEYGGSIKGVSREHAAIIRQQGSLCIVDRGSANGTYLNGQRLQPGEPWLLHDGDNVRLGQLVLHVAFVSSR